MANLQMKTNPWKLTPKHLRNFTGVLNGVYEVRDGVVQYAENRRPANLINYYGAIPAADWPKFEEAEKAAAKPATPPAK